MANQIARRQRLTFAPSGTTVALSGPEPRACHQNMPQATKWEIASRCRIGTNNR